MKINIKDFLSELNKQEILYCSWKNNHLLEDVFNCKKDLDLFVPLRQKAKFLSILHDHKFIEGESKLSSFPYIHHFYLPGENGRLFHLHVYFRLLTGESHLKDYWLPLEDRLEKNRERIQDNIFVPDNGTQRLIYVLRHYLKKSSIMGLLMHWRERADYSAELKNINCAEISSDITDIIDDNLIKQLDSSLDTSSIVNTWWLGVKLRSKIKSLKRTSASKAMIKRYGNMMLRIINKLTFRRKKTLIGGGRFIAITGLDGSGKTSIIEAISSTLSRDFSVRKVHVGRPPPTLLTLPVRFLLSLRKKVKSFNRTANKTDKLKTNQESSFEKTNLISALRYTILAYERNMLARKAYKKSCCGEIVISDRFPSTTLGKMDSPRISTKNTSKVIQYLAKKEQYYYTTMPQPDLLLELYVPVEVSILRNQERDKADKETDDEIRERYEINSNLIYQTSNHIRIDNNKPFDIAYENILENIWEALT